ncbi:MAG: aldehyde dehydrogenase family protein [Erysipelotrichaceae bacterium]|nr:aldehyde dehydrogenase family protein [Erysipelotrichaceae bacterium]
MNIHDIVMQVREFYNTHQTKDYAFRINALHKLHTALKSNEDRLLEALRLDLGKSENEGYMTELGIVYEEIAYMRRSLKRLMRPRVKSDTLVTFPSKCRIYYEPLGVVFIMSPWNYPLNLSLVPVVDAIAAGNCVILRPSEKTSHLVSVLHEIIANTFDENYVRVIVGPNRIATELLQEKFDLIFFTGGARIGQMVLEAASKHLTPVVLELGGKSPVILDKSCDVKMAAKRLAFGKCLNSGQTCIAPDYVFIPECIKEQFIHYFAEYVTQFYGDPIQCEYYPHMINQQQFDRAIGYLEGQEIVYGGTWDESSLKIAPTLVDHPSILSPIMQEEIFAPLLPLLPYEELSEVIEYINDRDKPLAMYIFSNTQANIDRLLKEVSFGGGCVNDVMFHLANVNLPFGGIGKSGMGSYHGAKGFETFSHAKSVLHRHKSFDYSFRFAPYNSSKLNILRMFIK